MMVTLIIALVQYNIRSRDVRNADDARLSMRQLSSNYSVPPIISAWRSRLTPGAYDLLLAQASQAMQYKAVRLDDTAISSILDEEPHYRVTHQGSKDAPSPFSLALDEDGNVATWQCLADFGLTPTDYHQAGHVVTLTSCTCNFLTCFRLPCRHVILLHLLCQEENNPEELFGSKWRLRDAAAQKEKEDRIRRAPPNSNGRVHLQRSVYTTDERFDIILDLQHV